MANVFTNNLICVNLQLERYFNNDPGKAFSNLATLR